MISCGLVVQQAVLYEIHNKSSLQQVQTPDPQLGLLELEMWANAQRDGRPAEYR